MIALSFLDYISKFMEMYSDVLRAKVFIVLNVWHVAALTRSVINYMFKGPQRWTKHSSQFVLNLCDLGNLPFFTAQVQSISRLLWMSFYSTGGWGESSNLRVNFFALWTGYILIIQSFKRCHCTVQIMHIISYAYHISLLGHTCGIIPLSNV